jgi:hypothetical protein
MALYWDIFGRITLGAELTTYIEWTYPNGEDVGPSFAEPQSGSAGELSPVPIEIQGFLKILHPNPKSVTYGALINNPNTFALHFHGDVGDFL